MTNEGYDIELLNNLLDYIERIEKTEHGMDGAVREIARRAAVIRGPVFRSGRGEVKRKSPVSVREAGERDDSTPVDVSDKTKTTYFDSVPAIEAEMKLHKGRE